MSKLDDLLRRARPDDHASLRALFVELRRLGYGKDLDIEHARTQLANQIIKNWLYPRGTSYVDTAFGKQWLRCLTKSYHSVAHLAFAQDEYDRGGSGFARTTRPLCDQTKWIPSSYKHDLLNEGVCKRCVKILESHMRELSEQKKAIAERATPT